MGEAAALPAVSVKASCPRTPLLDSSDTEGEEEEEEEATVPRAVVVEMREVAVETPVSKVPLFVYYFSTFLLSTNYFRNFSIGGKKL
jgi:hypothetical protein